MKSNQNNTKKSENSLFSITAKGSLGILALGDVGLRAWRKVKRAIPKNES